MRRSAQQLLRIFVKGAENMKKILEIKNLTKTFGRKGYESVVLKDVAMDIYEHDFIAIMGPSGAGKSTLLNLLSTLDKPCLLYTSHSYWGSSRPS